MTGFLTVTTAATDADNLLASIENARDAVGLSAGDESKDGTLNRLIAAASKIITGHCGRRFAIESLVEIFRSGPISNLSPFYTRVAPYGTPLDAQRRPLTLTRVPIVKDSVTVTTVDGPLTEGTDYELDYRAGTLDRLFDNTIGAWAQTPITVAYQAGYDLTTEIPADLENVCLSLVTAGFFAQGRDTGIASEMVQNVGSTSYWQRTIAAMAIDEGLAAQLVDYKQWVY
jgi:hypothetical protein